MQRASWVGVANCKHNSPKPHNQGIFQTGFTANKRPLKTELFANKPQTATSSHIVREWPQSGKPAANKWSRNSWVLPGGSWPLRNERIPAIIAHPAKNVILAIHPA
jgi:hypothetical protein